MFRMLIICGIVTAFHCADLTLLDIDIKLSSIVSMVTDLTERVENIEEKVAIHSGKFSSLEVAHEYVEDIVTLDGMCICV